MPLLDISSVHLLAPKANKEKLAYCAGFKTIYADIDLSASIILDFMALAFGLWAAGKRLFYIHPPKILRTGLSKPAVPVRQTAPIVP